jgi:hypothetical protein
MTPLWASTAPDLRCEHLDDLALDRVAVVLRLHVHEEVHLERSVAGGCVEVVCSVGSDDGLVQRDVKAVHFGLRLLECIDDELLELVC